MDTTPFLRAGDLLDIGQDPRQLAVRCRRGELVRVRRGLYVNATTWKTLDDTARYGLEVQAFQLLCRHQPVFCHATAALLWGLWLVGTPQRIHVITESAGGGRNRNSIVQHSGSLSAGVVACGDTLLTDKLITTLQLIATLQFDVAVAVCDSALRRPGRGQDLHPFGPPSAVAAGGRSTPFWHHDEPLGQPLERPELAAAAELLPTLRAQRRARAVIDFASALSGSPGESLSRALMHRLGFPSPVLQQRFRLRDGGTAFADFWFEEQRLVGEFDGKEKYLRPDWSGGASMSERFMAEKRREDQIREQGVRVIRWTWQDMKNESGFERLLQQAGLPQRPR